MNKKCMYDHYFIRYTNYTRYSINLKSSEFSNKIGEEYIVVCH